MNTLLVHASFGEGHKIAASALERELGAPCRDLLEFCPAFIRKIYVFSYHYLTDNLPFFWYLLFLMARSSVVVAFLARAHHWLFFPFLKYVRQNNPAGVIVTHFFPLTLAAFLKKELGFKLITIVTDLRAHPLWLNKEVDHYFVALPETKKDLVRLGVEEGKITAGFVALREGFLSPPELKVKFFTDEKPCLLFVSSVKGNFPYLKSLILKLRKEFNIFVIYGKNRKAQKELESIVSPSLKIFPFYEQMWELIALSSVIISKPGGLTIFEGVYKRKPFIFTHYIRGQEKENMDLLIKRGVARYARNEEEFLAAVHYFQANKDEISQNYPLEFGDIRPVLKNML